MKKSRLMLLVLVCGFICYFFMFDYTFAEEIKNIDDVKSNNLSTEEVKNNNSPAEQIKNNNLSAEEKKNDSLSVEEIKKQLREHNAQLFGVLLFLRIIFFFYGDYYAIIDFFLWLVIFLMFK